MSDNKQHNAHEKVEKNVGLMAVLIAVVVSFGALGIKAMGGIDLPPPSWERLTVAAVLGRLAFALPCLLANLANQSSAGDGELSEIGIRVVADAFRDHVRDRNSQTKDS